MCALCDGATYEEVFAGYRERIDKFGFTMVGVGYGNRAWLYTIGLLASFGHPELVMTGADIEGAYNVIDHAVDRVRSGENFDENSPDASFHGVPFRFGRVHPTQWVHGRFAMWETYYDWLGITPLTKRAVQVIWGNADDVFPPDPDFCHVHRNCQPLLSVPAAGDVHEVARRQRRPKKHRR